MVGLGVRRNATYLCLVKPFEAVDIMMFQGTLVKQSEWAPNHEKQEMMWLTWTLRLRQIEHDPSHRFNAAFALTTGVNRFLVRGFTFFPSKETSSP